MPPPARTQHAAPKKNRHITAWIALAVALMVLIAAGVAAASVYVAREQNIATEQQQLVNITISIAQQYASQQAAENQAAANLTGVKRSTAMSAAAAAMATESAAEGQTAAVLITSLHGDGVTGIEYIEVAKALAGAGDIGQAITYYNDAVNAAPHYVSTRSAALRQEAILYYSLGRSAIGHQDMMRSAEVYGGHPELTQADIDDAIAQAYLSDAVYQLSISCNVTKDDLVDAQDAVAPLGAGRAGPVVQALIATETATYRSKCP